MLEWLPYKGQHCKIICSIFLDVTIVTAITEEDLTRLDLIRMSHQQRSLLWKVVINVGNDLYSNICLSCTWRPNDLRENNDRKLNQSDSQFPSLSMTRMVSIAV